jgi:transposase InsO family protein
MSERQWPGRVFEDPELPYDQAMLDFVAASQASEKQANPDRKAAQEEKESLKEKKRALRREDASLRDERRQIREQRKLQDVAWKKIRTARKTEVQAYQKLSKSERRQERPNKHARDAHWCALRDQHRALLKARQQEDAEWRRKRLNFRERWSQLPIVTSWIAILVIVDNCTRQCLGLPLFAVGSQVTSEMIVEALQALLPPELLFLISDRGTHFTANAFKKLVRYEEFIHVLIARHRPQSNGIAERFVRTLKEWLADKPWQDDQELLVLLQQFSSEYNDRPHQGIAIPGLSPNEFAKRISVM